MTRKNYNKYFRKWLWGQETNWGTWLHGLYFFASTSAQVPFLSGMGSVAEIRTMFSAEVQKLLSFELRGQRLKTWTWTFIQSFVNCSIFCSVRGFIVARRPSFVISVCLNTVITTLLWQLLLKSKTKYLPAGKIIADSGGIADGMMVITSGKESVCFVAKLFLVDISP